MITSKVAITSEPPGLFLNIGLTSEESVQVVRAVGFLLAVGKESKMPIIFTSLMALLIFASFKLSSNTQLDSKVLAAQEERGSLNCKQPRAEQEALIREADKGRFTLRRLELIGNVSTADEVLHRKITRRMVEGNLFSRRNLTASLKNVSSLKTIYPVTMKDVVARLDKVEKTLDLKICFRERPQPVQLRNLTSACS